MMLLDNTKGGDQYQKLNKENLKERRKTMKGKGKVRTLLARHGIHVPVDKKLSGWHYKQYRKLKGG